VERDSRIKHSLSIFDESNLYIAHIRKWRSAGSYASSLSTPNGLHNKWVYNPSLDQTHSRHIDVVFSPIEVIFRCQSRIGCNYNPLDSLFFSWEELNGEWGSVGDPHGARPHPRYSSNNSLVSLCLSISVSKMPNRSIRHSVAVIGRFESRWSADLRVRCWHPSVQSLAFHATPDSHCTGKNTFRRTGRQRK
jgi:hypothetical protein